MFRSPRNGWIGIDVGASTLTLAQLSKQQGEIKLTAAASVNRTRGGDSIAAFQRDLDTVLAVAGDLQGKRTAAVLSMSSCQLESGQAPLTIDDEEPCVGSWPTGIESNNPDAGWYTLSATASEARAVADGLLSAGLSCRVLDGAPLVISRAAGMLAPTGGDPAAAVAVLDWGWSSATFCLAVNGYPVYVRALKDGGLVNAAATIAEELGLTPEESHEALTKHPPGLHASGAAESPLSKEITRLIRPYTDQVLCEVQRTLDYVRSYRRQVSVASLCLLGGGSLLPGAAPWLQAATELPTQLWRPPGVQGDKHAWSLYGPAIALSALAWEPRRG